MLCNQFMKYTQLKLQVKLTTNKVEMLKEAFSREFIFANHAQSVSNVQFYIVKLFN
jgi:hypothetical protein